ncbi:uncharacterized protein FPRO_14050 [Fusarium proliferatum ET1]|uniref:Uncharacterized protein n=1 Tax=Fusarium proliferatum (strain ET1) TaxID=1227346 RepID=A0A1L7VV30_FUSPR|nr:uncharacterized protein FPRO_14050 [Fusarium proliferatum ET1]CVL09870.1 uncharacterized protein FPRN_13428 [Fusarium proliferatum]CZR44289.1 uncharacterized protein FPRO_14050 [Fusarium proliferatum ET1]
MPRDMLLKLTQYYGVMVQKTMKMRCLCLCVFQIIVNVKLAAVRWAEKSLKIIGKAMLRLDRFSEAFRPSIANDHR